MKRDVEGVTRRQVLHASAVAAAAVGVAGCANSGSYDPTSTGGARRSDVVIELAEVPVGGVASVTIDRRPAFVARPTSDTVRAFSAVCTHQSCTVVAAGDQLVCPCHGSHFDLLTGDVVRGPAALPLPPIDVAISGSEVVRSR